MAPATPERVPNFAEAADHQTHAHAMTSMHGWRRAPRDP
jgi:hypothetical protein